MTRRAGVNSDETRANLIRAAIEEFREKGYSNSSLRRICNKAGVTTGALYFFFDSKNDLFEKAIEPTTSKLVQTIQEGYDSEFNSDDIDPSIVGKTAVSRRVLDICYENREVTDIILAHQDHPAVIKLHKALSDVLSTRLEILTRLLYDEVPETSILNHNTFSWFTQTETFLGRYVLQLNLPKEEALHQIDAIIRVLRCSMGALIETDERAGLLSPNKAQPIYKALGYAKRVD
ncbi:TetR/AcrR family transcriptional regulator [Gordonibacter sp. Marseille-P4307]|uniref:TetR/AcrR family transcriptional regulator n=1 Tax=Gordonibacter sp. Marseille-P4307 TaxID=2161815 RepID=UPI000F531B1B|nr:TetR/AcrR family transcriptional regulator [Gordonibacter sp. Marseille-P4307]